MTVAQFIIQGRPLGRREVEQVRQLQVEHSAWSRWRLSRELAALWNWRNGAGQLKDMATRTLLLKLEQRGYVPRPFYAVTLPALPPSITWTGARWDASPFGG